MRRPMLADPDARTHLAVLALVVAGSAVAARHPGWLTALPLGCALRRFTHLRCPFCGMTTDFITLWHGHLPRENPSSLPFAVVLYALYPAALLYAWHNRRFTLFSDRRLHSAAFALLVVMWIGNNLAR